jgi:hypothetical protein
MSFDKATRNRLARFVSDARGLLTEEFTRQLQHEYGLDPETGNATDLGKLTALDDARRETASILRETMAYYLDGKSGDTKERKEALDRILREQAFTVLNRLCALRLAEARDLILQSVGGGYQSQGFQLYDRLAGPALGETGEAYRTFLFSIFDELAVELPPLFDRFSPEGRLFPRPTALLALLDLISDSDLDALWAEDETIGWIYQYFNSQEERKAMRAASSAPRNSRELAVRNQFFTPRYVVEFLTDNTLGRIWYEMTRGETGLVDSCNYLVRRPTEIFLDEGVEAPIKTEPDEDLSQEELLKQPVYIPHRPLKDPREIKMLDPACGSMHFGLYAFDLFERIYAEAWDLEERLGSNAFQRLTHLDTLHETYPDKAAFTCDVPRLIIEKNIHGVDIDPRAVQIAGLSLWLRAQKSWSAQGLRQPERPQISKSNIVCAEPMPGDQQMLDDFLATLDETRLETLLKESLHLPLYSKLRVTQAMADALKILVRTVWQEMELAGEAGSLLKIEETLRKAIAKAREASAEKSPLFQVLEYGLGADEQNNLDFWDHAEHLVLAALQNYSEETIDDYQRRLFSEDATQGFAFIQLCQKLYDVVLMNPPFGDPSKKSKHYFSLSYTGQPFELYSNFIERFVSLSNLVGAITSHTFLTYGSFVNFRIKVLAPHANVKLLSDFGLGVMDDAMVRSAAYVLDTELSQSDGIYIRLVEDKNKQELLEECLFLLRKEKADPRRFIASERVFQLSEQFSYAYWAPSSLLKLLTPENNIGELVAKVLLGVVTSGNDQFLRLIWEIEPKNIGISNWAFYYKGGDFLKYFRLPHLVIDWRKNGDHISTGNSSAVRLRDRDQYFKPGLTYPLINEFGINVSVLPSNCIFDNGSPSVFSKQQNLDLFLLGLLSSRIAEFFIRCLTSTRHWQVGYVRQVPWSFPSDSEIQELSLFVEKAVNIQRSLQIDDELSQDFLAPPFFQNKKSLAQSIKQHITKSNKLIAQLLYLDFEIDNYCFKLYNLSEEVVNLVKQIIGTHPIEITKSESNEDSNLRIHKVTLTRFENVAWENHIPVDELSNIYPDQLITNTEVRERFRETVSYFFGCNIGRWDIRYSTKEKPPPELRNPLAPLPVCPRGMLQDDKGLPALPSDMPSNYPISISWSGIMVDDEGHQEDIIYRIRESLQVIWKEYAEVIESEICEILDVDFLRNYFQHGHQFFDDHLKRYSKRSRQAPIYWPLSTLSGSYTLWLYYHRINDQILFTCVNDFVDPKLKQVAEDSARLRQKSARSSDEENELERLVDFESELKDFRAELLRVAAFWKPNLNDGVQITAAPLWRLFQHKPWQKRLRATWEKLEAGDYDWAHLAYSIWPERVSEKCKTDKSLAIAHDLEHIYIEPPKKVKKNKKTKKKKASTNQSEIFNDN